MYFQSTTMTQNSASSAEVKSKLRIREERKRVIKICVSKLQTIQDPESYLCKSVLINNTLKSMQREHRDSQKRKLKRQNSSHDDDPCPTKKMHLENSPVTDEDNEENDNSDDISLNDSSNPLSSAYYDVNNYPSDTLDDVILCDNSTASIDIYCDEDTEDSSEDSVTTSVNISVKTLTTCDTPEDSVPHQSRINNNEELKIFDEEELSKSCNEHFSQSIMHNNSISLQT